MRVGRCAAAARPCGAGRIARMTDPMPTETAVIVAVPEAEPVVGRHRARLDWSAARGVPAHVTVLYPFVPPALVDDDVLARLAAAVRGTGGFTASWREVRWFGEDVAWLAPEPEQRFRALTEAVVAAFPQHPPYEGRFEDVTPHLTVGDQGTLADRRAAAADVRDGLPLTSEVHEVLLMAGSTAPGSWRTLAACPLG